MNKNIFSSMISLIAITTAAFALTACPGAAHDPGSGQFAAGNLREKMVGLWRTSCSTSQENNNSTQKELNISENGEVLSRQVIYSDLDCGQIDQPKTDAANSSQVGMTQKISAQGRGNRARGTATITTHDGSGKKMDRSESFNVAVIKAAGQNEQLIMKNSGDKSPSTTYDRVE